MNRRARCPVLARRPIGCCLAALLMILVFGPRPMTWGAEAAAAERNPQRELILLATGSISGNLAPCG